MENSMTNAEFNNLVQNTQLDTASTSALTGANFEVDVDAALAKLCTYWPVAKMVLKAAKLVSPPKIDKVIDEIIAIVGQLCGGASNEERTKLLEKFAMAWGTIKPILEKAKAVTGPKADAILDEVIKIGDLLAKS